MAVICMDPFWYTKLADEFINKLLNHSIHLVWQGVTLLAFCKVICNYHGVLILDSVSGRGPMISIATLSSS